MRNLALVATLGAGAVLAQPNAPTSADIACMEPGTDSVTWDARAADGTYSLFDGTMKGWWHSCKTGHSDANKAAGGIWKIDAATKAIYSTQRGSAGSILMTNKKFTNYELVWDYWPDFKNDGGIFNRTTADGRCFQTVLDYIGGASLGGSWGEGGFTGRDYRPFSFGNDENSITIPGNGQGEPSNWTTITQKLKAAGHQIPCPTAGCGQDDWRLLWDQNNWNQMRILFYGGNTGNTRVRMKSFFRKIGSNQWVPVAADTTLIQVIPENYIGLQVHGGGRFSGARGTWYKNIRWQPLNEDGSPKYGSVSVKADGQPGNDMMIDANSLSGFIALDHEITVTNLAGQRIQKLKGKAGSFSYALSDRAHGWLSLQIKTAKGLESRSILRHSH